MSIDPVLERCAIEVASATRSARAALRALQDLR